MPYRGASSQGMCVCVCQIRMKCVNSSKDRHGWLAGSGNYNRGYPCLAESHTHCIRPHAQIRLQMQGARLINNHSACNHIGLVCVFAFDGVSSGFDHLNLKYGWFIKLRLGKSIRRMNLEAVAISNRPRWQLTSCDQSEQTSGDPIWIFMRILPYLSEK